MTKLRILKVFSTAVCLTAFSGVLGAQTFAPIPPLSFTKAFAGANPLPQIVTVTSTGASLHFNVAVTTLSGGSWLSATPSGVGCCYTPEAITITANPDVSLAAGVYEGQVVITDYSDSSITMTVPVTLTVAASNTPFFANLPGQLSFSFPTGGNSPPQLIQIRNGGTGTLNWKVTATTADDGSWLTVSPTGGTAPTTINVGITPGNLPGGGQIAGTYTGQLLFQTATGNVTIPVSVTVGGGEFEQINPISFTMPYAGANPLLQILTVVSATVGTHFDAAVATATGGNWLQISPQGNGCCYTPEAITVSVNASTLAAGTYTGEITFSDYNGLVEAMTVPVTLTVAASNTPFFANLPGQLSFSFPTGGNSPPQLIQIRNGGTGTLNWKVTATTADDGSWLTVSPTGGTAPTTVSVGITPGNLPGGGQIAGTYTGQLLFQTAGDSEVIPVSVTVGGGEFEQINPISFTMPYAGANPLPQILTVVSATVGTHFDAAVATATGGNWLQISPQGNGCCYTPEAITVSVNASTLAAGTYTGEITFSDYNGLVEAMTVPVTLTVAASNTPFFANLPGQLSFSFPTGGNSPPQLIQIRNGGTGTLNWKVTATTADDGSWLTVSPTGGTAPTTVSVGITPGNLPGGGQIAGTYTGQLLFQTAGDSEVIPVSVTVGGGEFEQINPISFTMPYAGANPLPQILTVVSATVGTHFDAAVATATGGNWLQISPQGNGCCYTPEAITVSVNASTLAAGTYTGEITFSDYNGLVEAMTVPVTLTVAASGSAFFDNMQGQISFSFQPSSQNPPVQRVQVSNAGSGTLNWTLTATTADDGKWLVVSAGKGAAPSTVFVKVVSAKLPGGGLIPGTYIGELVFQAPGSRVSIPVSVTIGDDVLSQLPAVSFTAVSGTNPLPQTITVSSIGSSLHFDAIASTGKGGNWLSISPQGNGCCYTPEGITVSVDVSGLAAGTYTGQIDFSDYSGLTEDMTVPVILTVTEADVVR